MPEQVGQPEPSTNDTVGAVMETTSAPEAKPFINTDGSFQEKWVDSLDEDLRTEATLPRFKNVKDLARSYVDVRKMVGKDKIAVPTEKSSPAEWEAYYNAGGRPKTVGDYKLDYPKDMPTPENVNLRKAFLEYSHKVGKSQKQVEADYQFHNNMIKQAILAQKQQEELQLAENEKQLKSEWGNAFEQRVHFGNIALEEFAKVSPEFKDKLIQKLGNDPDFIRFASYLGSMFGEGKAPSHNVPTPSDIQNLIDDAMHEPAYMNASDPGHKRAIEKVQRMFEARNSQKR